jgi:hypothetical protein
VGEFDAVSGGLGIVGRDLTELKRNALRSEGVDGIPRASHSCDAKNFHGKFVYSLNVFTFGAVKVTETFNETGHSHLHLV